LVETAAYLVEGTTILAHPRKHLVHHAGFVKDQLEAGFPSAFLLVHVAIAVGRMTQDPHASLLGSMAFAAAAAFEELGPLVFSEDSLHVQEQLIFWSRCEWAIQKDHLHPLVGQLLQQEDLIRVVTRQPVGRLHVHAI